MNHLTDFERKQHVWSLDSKQMSPTASHLSRKKLMYRLILVKRKKFCDMAMNTLTFDVPSMEEVMKIPLM